ncbi:hypothetical protein OEV98_15040 [Caldibacillus lycopersici]|uniref:YhfM-like domain-containing protein n=1 Tax=Perspicuibacillus lycopersici TaxID=1325689 RepID=A0AAE3IUJ5_9BACI|nr:hypothetical protein [Perspicuibacillus lycopersici]MCU9614858.1 hypothetical protein [Perspicuibacillus lycopersici]
MKYYFAVLFFIGILFITGCSTDNQMVLLEEEISSIDVAISNGAGEMNEDIMHTFNDSESILLFETAITSAKRGESNVVSTKPDYDVVVNYRNGSPSHAIHIWLGEKNEKSTLMYMVDYATGEGQTYVSTLTSTNQLRDLILTGE